MNCLHIKFLLPAFNRTLSIIIKQDPKQRVRFASMLLF